MVKPLTPRGFARKIKTYEYDHRSEEGALTSEQAEKYADEVMAGKPIDPKYGIDPGRIPSQYHPDPLPAIVAPPLPPARARIVALKEDMTSKFTEWQAILEDMLKEAK